MVDLSLLQPGPGYQPSSNADIQGLSTDLVSLQSSFEGCISQSDNQPPLDDQTISVHPPTPVKAVVTIPISRLAFPFSFTIPSPRRQCSAPTVSPTPPRQCKLVRVPSPLAAREDVVQAKAQLVSHAAPYRSNRHHGFSRQALLHTKWFWSLREEESRKHESAKPETVPPRLETSDGLPTSLPKLHNDSDCPRTMRTVDCPEQPASTPPLTIYPRRGELAGLRDTYCVEADRCFANVPIWTLAKVLWVHDMHAFSTLKSAEDPNCQQAEEDDEFDESASEISFDTTGSVGFSDDSESTLVDSEPEWDTSNEEPIKGTPVGPYSRASLQSPSSSTSSLRTDGEPPAPLDWAKDVYLKPMTASRLSRAPIRSTNWYRRWEVLLDLSHTEKRPEKSPPIKAKPLPAHDVPKITIMPPKPSSPAKRISFTRGFLSGLKKANSAKPSRGSSYIVQESFLDPSHPAAG